MGVHRGERFQVLDVGLAGVVHVRVPSVLHDAHRRRTGLLLISGSVGGDRVVEAVGTGYEREKGSRERDARANQRFWASICRPHGRLCEARLTRWGRRLCRPLVGRSNRS